MKFEKRTQRENFLFIHNLLIHMEIKIATLKGIDTIIKLGNSVNEFQISNKVVTFWPKEVLVDCIKNKNNKVQQEKNCLEYCAIDGRASCNDLFLLLCARQKEIRRHYFAKKSIQSIISFKDLEFFY